MLHPRKKSASSSATDVRKSAAATDSSTKHRRPAAVRRHTPASAQLLGRRHRERERDTWDDEHESFPQFCMTCEKQFIPQDDRFLYCSESCRRIDQNSTSMASLQAVPSSRFSTYAAPELGRPAPASPEPRDIIPRATPSRPVSIHLSNSPPGSPGTKAHHSSAISALRSLNLGPSSPPSPTGSSSGGGGGIWPFGGRSVTTTSPGASYTRPPAPYLSSTLDVPSYYGAMGYANAYDAGSDRPLPPRHPHTYSRPKSIELVTPVLGR